MRKKLILLFFFLLLQISTLSADKNVTKAYVRPAFILASSNLEFVFPQIIQAFYKKYPNASVHIQYDSSGYLADAILHGKEYDIYFSANKRYPAQIYKAKKSATKAKDYVQGLLILFVPKYLPLQKEGIKVLASKKIKNITIANKKTAPYGVAAMQVLKNSKCDMKTLKKVRYSSDVATAIDNVIWRGDAGFLSKSALYILPKGRKKKGRDWIQIDTKLYNPIIQAYVISKEGLKNPNAQKFLRFIHSNVGKKIFQDNGYINLL